MENSKEDRHQMFPLDSIKFSNLIAQTKNQNMCLYIYNDNHTVDCVSMMGQIEEMKDHDFLTNTISRDKHVHYFYLNDNQGKTLVEYYWNLACNDIKRCIKCSFCSLTSPFGSLIRVIGSPKSLLTPQGPLERYLLSSKFEIISNVPKERAIRLSYQALSVKALDISLSTPVREFHYFGSKSKTKLLSNNEEKDLTKLYKNLLQDVKTESHQVFSRIIHVFMKYCLQFNGSLKLSQIENYLLETGGAISQTEILKLIEENESLINGAENGDCMPFFPIN